MSDTTNSALPADHREFLSRFLPEGFVNEIPDTVCHYTDSRGLHGILACGSIWLTSFKFMNDYTEFKYGLAVLGKKLRQFLDPKNYDPQFIDMCKRIWSFLQTESEDPVLKPYVFCLTEKKDHLSQWRGYAEFGKGFCVELRVSEIQRVNSSVPLYFGKVQYDEQMLEGLMAELVQQWLELCSSTAKKNDNTIPAPEARDLALLLMQAAYALAIKMKHPGFENEAEWRLFTFVPRGSGILKFRAHRFGLADYYDLAIEPSKLVTEVMSGPCGPDPSYLKSSLQSLFPMSSAGTIVYSKSSIPFV